MDELNLYDDLDEFQEEQDKKSKELQDVEEKYQQSLKIIEELEMTNRTLKKKIQRIELSFQSLLDTARTEIKRKDKEIERLRKEKDDICFRRRIPQQRTKTLETQHIAEEPLTTQPQQFVKNPFRSAQKETIAPACQNLDFTEEVLTAIKENKYKDDSQDEFTESSKRYRSHDENRDDYYRKKFKNDQDDEKYHERTKFLKSDRDTRNKERYSERERWDFKDLSRNRLARDVDKQSLKSYKSPERQNKQLERSRSRSRDNKDHYDKNLESGRRYDRKNAYKSSESPEHNSKCLERGRTRDCKRSDRHQAKDWNRSKSRDRKCSVKNSSKSSKSPERKYHRHYKDRDSTHLQDELLKNKFEKPLNKFIDVYQDLGNQEPIDYVNKEDEEPLNQTGEQLLSKGNQYNEIANKKTEDKKVNINISKNDKNDQQIKQQEKKDESIKNKAKEKINNQKETNDNVSTQQQKQQVSDNNNCTPYKDLYDELFDTLPNTRDSSSKATNTCYSKVDLIADKYNIDLVKSDLINDTKEIGRNLIKNNSSVEQKSTTAQKLCTPRKLALYDSLFGPSPSNCSSNTSATNSCTSSESLLSNIKSILAKASNTTNIEVISSATTSPEDYTDRETSFQNDNTIYDPNDIDNCFTKNYDDNEIKKNISTVDLTKDDDININEVEFIQIPGLDLPAPNCAKNDKTNDECFNDKLKVLFENKILLEKESSDEICVINEGISSQRGIMNNSNILPASLDKSSEHLKTNETTILKSSKIDDCDEENSTSAKNTNSWELSEFEVDTRSISTMGESESDIEQLNKSAKSGGSELDLNSISVEPKEPYKMAKTDCYITIETASKKAEEQEVPMLTQKHKTLIIAKAENLSQESQTIQESIADNCVFSKNTIDSAKSSELHKNQISEVKSKQTQNSIKNTFEDSEDETPMQKGQTIQKTAADTFAISESTFASTKSSEVILVNENPEVYIPHLDLISIQQQEPLKFSEKECHTTKEIAAKNTESQEVFISTKNQKTLNDYQAEKSMQDVKETVENFIASENNLRYTKSSKSADINDISKVSTPGLVTILDQTQKSLKISENECLTANEIAETQEVSLLTEQGETEDVETKKYMMEIQTAEVATADNFLQENVADNVILSGSIFSKVSKIQIDKEMLNENIATESNNISEKVIDQQIVKSQSTETRNSAETSSSVYLEERYLNIEPSQQEDVSKSDQTQESSKGNKYSPTSINVSDSNSLQKDLDNETCIINEDVTIIPNNVENFNKPFPIDEQIFSKGNNEAENNTTSEKVSRLDITDKETVKKTSNQLQNSNNSFYTEHKVFEINTTEKESVKNLDIAKEASNYEENLNKSFNIEQQMFEMCGADETDVKNTQASKNSRSINLTEKEYDKEINTVNENAVEKFNNLITSSTHTLAEENDEWKGINKIQSIDKKAIESSTEEIPSFDLTEKEVTEKTDIVAANVLTTSIDFEVSNNSFDIEQQMFEIHTAEETEGKTTSALKNTSESGSTKKEAIGKSENNFTKKCEIIIQDVKIISANLNNLNNSTYIKSEKPKDDSKIFAKSSSISVSRQELNIDVKNKDTVIEIDSIDQTSNKNSAKTKNTAESDLIENDSIKETDYKIQNVKISNDLVNSDKSLYIDYKDSKLTTESTQDNEGEEKIVEIPPKGNPVPTKSMASKNIDLIDKEFIKEIDLETETVKTKSTDLGFSQKTSKISESENNVTAAVRNDDSVDQVLEYSSANNNTIPSNLKQNLNKIETKEASNDSIEIQKIGVDSNFNDSIKTNKSTDEYSEFNTSAKKSISLISTTTSNETNKSSKDLAIVLKKELSKYFESLNQTVDSIRKNKSVEHKSMLSQIPTNPSISEATLNIESERQEARNKNLISGSDTESDKRNETSKDIDFKTIDESLDQNSMVTKISSTNNKPISSVLEANSSIKPKDFRSTNEYQIPGNLKEVSKDFDSAIETQKSITSAEAINNNFISEFSTAFNDKMLSISNANSNPRKEPSDSERTGESFLIKVETQANADKQLTLKEDINLLKTQENISNLGLHSTLNILTKSQNNFEIVTNESFKQKGIHLKEVENLTNIPDTLKPSQNKLKIGTNESAKQKEGPFEIDLEKNKQNENQIKLQVSPLKLDKNPFKETENPINKADTDQETTFEDSKQGEKQQELNISTSKFDRNSPNFWPKTLRCAQEQFIKQCPIRKNEPIESNSNISSEVKENFQKVQNVDSATKDTESAKTRGIPDEDSKNCENPKEPTISNASSLEGREMNKDNFPNKEVTNANENISLNVYHSINSNVENGELCLEERKSPKKNIKLKENDLLIAKNLIENPQNSADVENYQNVYLRLCKDMQDVKSSDTQETTKNKHNLQNPNPEECCHKQNEEKEAIEHLPPEKLQILDPSKVNCVIIPTSETNLNDIEMESISISKLKDTYNKPSQLPSIATNSPTPSNFSGLFSKKPLENDSKDDDFTKSKKKSPHFTSTKLREYILPAASVLCNIDNLENATKANKKLHWELLDNKNEMTEIEDDTDVDNSDEEMNTAKKEGYAKDLIPWKESQLKLTPYKCTETLNSDSDTLSEEETRYGSLSSLNIDPYKQKFLKQRRKTIDTVPITYAVSYYKQLEELELKEKREAKKLKKKEARKQLNFVTTKVKKRKKRKRKNVKAKLKASNAIRVRNVESLMDVGFVKETVIKKTKFAIVLPKKQRGRPKKIENVKETVGHKTTKSKIEEALQVVKETKKRGRPKKIRDEDKIDMDLNKSNNSEIGIDELKVQEEPAEINTEILQHHEDKQRGKKDQQTVNEEQQSENEDLRHTENVQQFCEDIPNSTLLSEINKPPDNLDDHKIYQDFLSNCSKREKDSKISKQKQKPNKGKQKDEEMQQLDNQEQLRKKERNQLLEKEDQLTKVKELNRRGDNVQNFVNQKEKENEQIENQERLVNKKKQLCREEQEKLQLDNEEQLQKQKEELQRNEHEKLQLANKKQPAQQQLRENAAARNSDIQNVFKTNKQSLEDHRVNQELLLNFSKSNAEKTRNVADVHNESSSSEIECSQENPKRNTKSNFNRENSENLEQNIDLKDTVEQKTPIEIEDPDIEKTYNTSISHREHSNDGNNSSVAENSEPECNKYLRDDEHPSTSKDTKISEKSIQQNDANYGIEKLAVTSQEPEVLETQGRDLEKVKDSLKDTIINKKESHCLKEANYKEFPTVSPTKKCKTLIKSSLKIKKPNVKKVEKPSNKKKIISLEEIGIKVRPFKGHLSTFRIPKINKDLGVTKDKSWKLETYTDVSKENKQQNEGKETLTAKIEDKMLLQREEKCVGSTKENLTCIQKTQHYEEKLNETREPKKLQHHKEKNYHSDTKKCESTTENSYKSIKYTEKAPKTSEDNYKKSNRFDNKITDYPQHSKDHNRVIFSQDNQKNIPTTSRSFSLDVYTAPKEVDILSNQHEIDNKTKEVPTTSFSSSKSRRKSLSHKRKLFSPDLYDQEASSDGKLPDIVQSIEEKNDDNGEIDENLEATEKLNDIVSTTSKGNNPESNIKDNQQQVIQKTISSGKRSIKLQNKILDTRNGVLPNYNLLEINENNTDNKNSDKLVENVKEIINKYANSNASKNPENFTAESNATNKTSLKRKSINLQRRNLDSSSEDESIEEALTASHISHVSIQESVGITSLRTIRERKKSINLNRIIVDSSCEEDSITDLTPLKDIKEKDKEINPEVFKTVNTNQSDKFAHCHVKSTQSLGIRNSLVKKEKELSRHINESSNTLTKAISNNEKCNESLPAKPTTSLRMRRRSMYQERISSNLLENDNKEQAELLNTLDKNQLGVTNPPVKSLKLRRKSMFQERPHADVQQEEWENVNSPLLEPQLSTDINQLKEVNSCGKADKNPPPILCSKIRRKSMYQEGITLSDQQIVESQNVADKNHQEVFAHKKPKEDAAPIPVTSLRMRRKSIYQEGLQQEESNNEEDTTQTNLTSVKSFKMRRKSVYEEREQEKSQYSQDKYQQSCIINDNEIIEPQGSTDKTHLEIDDPKNKGEPSKPIPVKSLRMRRKSVHQQRDTEEESLKYKKDDMQLEVVKPYKKDIKNTPDVKPLKIQMFQEEVILNAQQAENRQPKGSIEKNQLEILNSNKDREYTKPIPVKSLRVRRKSIYQEIEQEVLKPENSEDKNQQEVITSKKDASDQPPLKIRRKSIYQERCNFTNEQEEIEKSSNKVIEPSITSLRMRRKSDSSHKIKEIGKEKLLETDKHKSVLDLHNNREIPSTDVILNKDIQNNENNSDTSIDFTPKRSNKMRRKSINQLRILDSSDEDQKPISHIKTMTQTEEKTPVTIKNPRKRRVVKVLSTSQEEDAAIKNLQIYDHTTQVFNTSNSLISPTFNHPIFHTDVNQHHIDTTPMLPPTPNKQYDDKFKEIDSKLNEIFQSPQYMIDDKTSHPSDISTLSVIPATLNNSQSNITIEETIVCNQENDQSSINTTQFSNLTTSLNDSTSLAQNLNDVKHLSLGSSDYRFEKVSDNVVNLFISRKRKRKRNN